MWIMNMDVNPVDAVKDASDASVCGDCAHKPSNNNSCYVNLGQAPLQVWKAYKRGSYSRYKNDNGDTWRKDIYKPVRWGAYGDPAAIPTRLYRPRKGDTSYTHQWQRFKGMRNNTMASVDTCVDRDIAVYSGWKTFRVQSDVYSAALSTNEIYCPATPEGGNRSECSTCGLCNGRPNWSMSKSIVVKAHGNRASNIK